MSINGTGNPQNELNRMNPASSHAKLGDVVNDLITSVNLLIKSLNSSVLSAPGLVIKAGSSTLVKAGAAFAAAVNGAVVRKAANTDMAAISGVIATTKSAAWAFYIDATGALTASAKTADAASHDAAIALLPAVPDNVAQVGFIVVDNAAGGNFTAGTTALDAASTTTTYYSGTCAPVLAVDAVNTAITTLLNR